MCPLIYLLYLAFNFCFLVEPFVIYWQVLSVTFTFYEPQCFCYLFCCFFFFLKRTEMKKQNKRKRSIETCFVCLCGLLSQTSANNSSVQAIFCGLDRVWMKRNTSSLKLLIPSFFSSYFNILCLFLFISLRNTNLLKKQQKIALANNQATKVSYFFNCSRRRLWTFFNSLLFLNKCTDK